MLSVIMLSVIMLSVNYKPYMLSALVLIVVMLYKIANKQLKFHQNSYIFSHLNNIRVKCIFQKFGKSKMIYSRRLLHIDLKTIFLNIIVKN